MTFKFSMKNNKDKNWKETNRENIKIKKLGKVGEKKCPACGGTNFSPTGKTHDGNRVYKCVSKKYIVENGNAVNKICGEFIGVGTTWAHCDIKGMIGSDLFINDCKVCKIPKKEGIDITKQKCPHFIERGYMDEKS